MIQNILITKSDHLEIEVIAFYSVSIPIRITGNW